MVNLISVISARVYKISPSVGPLVTNKSKMYFTATTSLKCKTVGTTKQTLLVQNSVNTSVYTPFIQSSFSIYVFKPGARLVS